MKILKGFLLFVVVLIFLNSLLLISVLWTLNNTIARRDVVKSWFEDSGIYNNIVDKIIVESNKELTKEGESTKQQDDIDVKILSKAATTAFSPEVLKTTTNTLLDSVYDWLDGDSPNLTFKIDLIDQKAAFTSALADEAKIKLESLPECTSSQLLQFESGNIFSATCRPPNYLQEVDRFKNEFDNNEDFLPNALFTEKDIKVRTKDGVVTVDKALPEAPKAYQAAKLSVWLFIIFGIMSAAGIVFLSKTKRRGANKISGILIFSAVIIGTIGFIVSRITTVFDSTENSIQETIAIPFAKEVTNSVSVWNYIFAIIFGTVAVIIILGLYITKSKVPNGKQSMDLGNEQEKSTLTNQPSLSNEAELPSKKTENSNVKDQKPKG